jgi:2-phospho-L-lactate guanylyltransferase
LWAVVPVKDTHDAKQRLADILNQNEREQLFRAMLHDVFAALAATDLLAGVMVVTRDGWVIEFAEKHGFRVVFEPQNLGHTHAVMTTARDLAEQGASGMLTIPGDVPLVTRDELRQILHAHRDTPAFTIVPSRDQLGSNAIACSPPDIIPLRFGDNSFYPHLEIARQTGIEPQVLRLPGLGLDIDRPDDLMTFLRTPSVTHTYRHLLDSGIADRLQVR